MLDTQIIHEFTNAAGRGETDTVKSFAEAHPEAIDARDWEGSTALLCAAWHGKINTVKALLELGASCTIADDQHYTPLTAAIREDNRAVAAILVRHVAADAAAFAQAMAAVEESRNDKLIAYVRKAIKPEEQRAAERRQARAFDARLDVLKARPCKGPFGGRGKP